jgi:hypothetical protein
MAASAARAGEGARPAPTSHGVAVVELFTSEGCSSCPPAEDVFDRVVSEAQAAGDAVVPLAFHVDYWDSLGWPDRFSSPAFTERQQDYSRAFGESSLYTPEMIVAGSEHFVGSNRARAETAIAAALSRPAAVEVALRVVRSTPDTFAVHYAIGGAGGPPSKLWIGLVQRSATVHVAAGENAGRTLRHTHVVRAFVESSVSADSAGSANGDAVIRSPWSPGRHEADIVAIVARGGAPRGGEILGAASIDVSP